MKTEFEKFYHDGAWDNFLENVIIPQEDMISTEGLQVSWDRRAAYIAFKLIERLKAKPK